MKIGFIGLGIMGESMSENIIKKHDDKVYVNDNKREQVEKLAAVGGIPCKDNIEVAKNADILIAAVGKPLFVTEDMVKEGAVVIDVGVNRIPDSSKKSGFRLVGDCDYDDVAEIASYITPVPGGVGLLTRLSLLVNLISTISSVLNVRLLKL